MGRPPSVLHNAHILVFILEQIDERLGQHRNTFAPAKTSQKLQNHYLKKWAKDSNYAFARKPYKPDWLRKTFFEVGWDDYDTTDVPDENTLLNVEGCINALFELGSKLFTKDFLELSLIHI